MKVRHRRSRSAARRCRRGPRSPGRPRAPLRPGRPGRPRRGCGRQRAGVPHEFPSAGRGDPAGMADAQIPGVRLARGGERTDDRRRVRVDERQGRHGVVRTPGPATATGNVHDREAIVRKRCRSAGHAHPLDPRCPTVTIGAWAIRAAPRERSVPGRPAARRSAVHRSRAAAATCAVRCCRRRCRGGAAGPSGSTWRCWRPTNPSSGAGRIGCPNSTWQSTRSPGSPPRTPTACSGRRRSSPTGRSHWPG